MTLENAKVLYKELMKAGRTADADNILIRYPEAKSGQEVEEPEKVPEKPPEEPTAPSPEVPEVKHAKRKKGRSR